MHRQTVPPAMVLLDIEGTTAPISFVHQVLFPYARKAIGNLLRDRADDPAVQAALSEIDKLAPGKDPLGQLYEWMDRDEKVAPLKVLQGLVWQEGYARGELIGKLYPDVLPALHRWQQAGTRLAVYSSGSEAAQRLIYGHTTEGDQTALFENFFDLRVGGKRDAESYRAIAKQSDLPANQIIFFSDVVAELDAAHDAGMLTVHIVRPDDGTIAGTRHFVASDFEEAGKQFNLPGHS